MTAVNPNLKSALEFAKKDIKLFPTFWKSGHKPLVKWGIEASSNLIKIQTWSAKWPNCYFCIALQASNLAVLDVDNKKGKKGLWSLFDLELKYGALPETLTVKTPSGGRHYIFKGAVPITVSKIGEGIDTPVMIPLPGTTIEGKGTYEVLHDNSIKETPKWLFEKTGEIREKKHRIENPTIELDLMRNQDRAVEYLKSEAEYAFEGGGGDAITYQTACKVRDFGISENLCLEFMTEFWNEFCEPPWCIDELAKKINNAYNYARSTIGQSTPQADFPPLSKKTLSILITSSGAAVIPLSKFTGAPPPRRWLIENVLPMGEISALYGDGGMGKSLLSMQLGLNVAAGAGEFLEFPIIAQMPVLIVSCEDKKDEIHRRIHAIRRAPEYEFLDMNVPFYVSPRVGEVSDLGYQEGNIVRPGIFLPILKDMLKIISGGKDALLIMDTLSDIFAINENDRQIASFCIKTILGGLIKESNCTILLIAHPSKTSQRDKIYDSGSTGWRNSIRNMLALVPHDNENLKSHRWLHQTKSNYSARMDSVLLKWEHGRFIRDDENVIVDLIKEKNVATVLELLKEQCCKNPPTPVGLHHLKMPNIDDIRIINAAGGVLNRNIKRKIINELIIDGLIKQVKGRSRSTENGLWPVSVLGRLGKTGKRR